jgi:hypothetical protein
MKLKFSVGDLTIHRIIEQETTFLQAQDMLPDLTPDILAENRAWMKQIGALDDTDTLILCFQSYIVKTPHHTVLIDSCIGNDKPRFNRSNMKTDDSYMRALAASGFCRPCWLEYAAGKRTVGADLPQRPLCVRQERVRLLVQHEYED